MGNVWLVRPEFGDWSPARTGDWERMLVADCAGPDGTVEWMAANGIILEVDYETARRWGTIGRGVKVEVTR